MLQQCSTKILQHNTWIINGEENNKRRCNRANKVLFIHFILSLRNHNVLSITNIAIPVHTAYIYSSGEMMMGNKTNNFSSSFFFLLSSSFFLISSSAVVAAATNQGITYTQHRNRCFAIKIDDWVSVARNWKMVKQFVLTIWDKEIFMKTRQF